ncbi:sce7726 family protein [Mesorhizobium sp. B2-3-14]|uniref:sce7726 family protein n=1 Tax=Mesorhizobium sp. B2-3-14 TaxID=2589950 RepID=UPI0011263275|nr:sce7726 family protein [Mesorhizobium sp. B2-3-14]TPL84173.1 sce7726 family protein [Mesorhizobium sp. B2-3-14]
MNSEKAEPTAKAALLSALKMARKLSRSTVMSELVVGGQSNRADIVLANDRLSCFEIKTHADTLVRLPKQLDTFTRCFDETTVVAASKHLSAVRALVPDFVGVMELAGAPKAPEIIVHRQASTSSHLSVEFLLQLLPADRLRLVLGGRGLPKKRADLMQHAQAMSIEDARAAVIAFLRDRYRVSSKAFASGAQRSVKCKDLLRLRRLHRIEASTLDDNEAQEWEIFQYVGQSFGQAPPEITKAFTKV